MKSGWQLKELAEVSSINYGYTDSASSEPVGPRFLRITDIQDDHVDWETVPYCRIESTDAPKYKLASGDIVFARTGATTGKSFLVNEPPDAVFASYLIRLRLIDNKLMPEFVSLFFQTAGYWQSVKDGSSGSAQGGFNATKLGALSIPIPPLPEQQRIVGILDEAFESIATAKANCEKNLQNARALFESHLNDVFTQRGEGWVERRLDAVAEFSQGIQVGLGDQSNVPKKGLVRFIRIVDYTQGTDDIRYVQDPGRRYWADASDIVMVRYGTPGLVGRGIEGVIANNLFKISIVDGSLTKNFLAYFLGQEAIQDYLSSQGSSTMPALTFTQLGAVVVSFPLKLEEQNEIVRKLDSIRKETQRLESLYQRKLTALDELKKSLLHHAFSGQL